jgi:hypothetical protein
MVDVERLTSQKIDRLREYLSPHISIVLQARHEILIETLQSAPRSEPELTKLIEQKKQELHKTNKVEDCEPIGDELDALEWLRGLIVNSKIRPLNENSLV